MEKWVFPAIAILSDVVITHVYINNYFTGAKLPLVIELNI